MTAPAPISRSSRAASSRAAPRRRKRSRPASSRRTDGPWRKPSETLAPDAHIEARAPYPWVSRGGVKLAAALDRFDIDPSGRLCLDIGASTGGFTDVLLARGAAHVTAVDVGHGQAHPRIAGDAARDAASNGSMPVISRRRHLPAPPTLIVMDASFISLTLILPAVLPLAAAEADLVALVKPQFEGAANKGGIVRDENEREAALGRVADCIARSRLARPRGHALADHRRRRQRRVPASRERDHDPAASRSSASAHAAKASRMTRTVRSMCPIRCPATWSRRPCAGSSAEMRALVEPSPDRVAPFCRIFHALRRLRDASRRAAPAIAVEARSGRGGARAGRARCACRCPASTRMARAAAARRSTRGAARTDTCASASWPRARMISSPSTIARCLRPSMAECPARRARRRDASLASAGKPLDIAVTATRSGLDVDVRGTGPLDDAHAEGADREPPAGWISRAYRNHGRPIVTFRTPTIRVGRAADVDLPPGGFLQATQAGEDALAALVLDATARRESCCRSLQRHRHVRAAARAHAPMSRRRIRRAMRSRALRAAAGWATGLHALRSDVRDLARRPLSRRRTHPVRRGRLRSAARRRGRTGRPNSHARKFRWLSASPATRRTFARDAKLLVDGGYALERVTPVDQFRHSAHVELVGVFRRAKQKKKRKLLG